MAPPGSPNITSTPWVSRLLIKAWAPVIFMVRSFAVSGPSPPGSGLCGGVSSVGLWDLSGRVRPGSMRPAGVRSRKWPKIESTSRLGGRGRATGPVARSGNDYQELTGARQDRHGRIVPYAGLRAQGIRAPWLDSVTVEWDTVAHYARDQAVRRAGERRALDPPAYLTANATSRSPATSCAEAARRFFCGSGARWPTAVVERHEGPTGDR